jgi:hypothetical protein
MEGRVRSNRRRGGSGAVVADLHDFEEKQDSDLDPHKSKQAYPDPTQSEKRDPDPLVSVSDL